MDNLFTNVRVGLILVVLLHACAASTPRECMRHERETYANGKEGRRWKNVGGCTCQEAVAKERETPAMDKWYPDCDENGRWKPKQTQMFHAWCVDENGNQNTALYGGPGQMPRDITCTRVCMKHEKMTIVGGSKERRWKNVGGCTCAEALAKEMERPGLDAYYPDCTTSGRWKRKQTQGLQAWCVEENGDQFSATWGGPGKMPSDLQCGRDE